MNEQVSIDELKETLVSYDSSIIQDNKLGFTIEENQYRVCMPSQRILELAERAKHSAWVKLLREPNTITRKKLITLLKDTQDIDIKELENKKEDLKKALHDAYISLHHTKDNDTKRIELYTQKIQEIRTQSLELFWEIEEYLSACIENQIEAIYLKTLACHCTETYNKETNKWKNVWNNYEEFQKDNSRIATEACLNFGYLFKFNRGY